MAPAPTKDDITRRVASQGVMIGLWSNPQHRVVAWSPLDSQIDNPHGCLTRFFTEQETCEILEVYPAGAVIVHLNRRCAYWREQLGVT
jgi:hypothetical protein